MVPVDVGQNGSVVAMAEVDSAIQTVGRLYILCGFYMHEKE